MPYYFRSWYRPSFSLFLKVSFVAATCLANNTTKIVILKNSSSRLPPTGSWSAATGFKYYSPVLNTIDIARRRCGARFGVRASTAHASMIAGCAKPTQTVFVSEPHRPSERGKSQEREAQWLGRAAEEWKE